MWFIILLSKMDTNIYVNNKMIYLIAIEGEAAFKEKYSTILDDKTNLETLIYINKVSILYNPVIWFPFTYTQ